MGKIAFLFSGQGAQKTGMGKELADCSKEAAKVFAMADEIRPGTSTQCFSGSNEELFLTKNTQPCLFCVDLAAAMALKEKGVDPDYLAGFSLGEIPALALGGYLKTEDAFRFVVKRAEYMDQCCNDHPGVMYAVVKITAEQVEAICSGVEGSYPVNYNESGQTVVACIAEAGKAFEEAVKEAGGRALKLSVSGGFHSPMMDDAAKKLREEFADITFQKPEIPVVSNVTAKEYTDAELLLEQVHRPVMWQKTVMYLAENGVDTFIEVGIGKTLSNLVRKILPEALVLNVEDEASLAEAQEVLKNA